MSSNKSGLTDEEVLARKEALLSIAQECVTEENLESLLRNKSEFNLYDGFEPSGRMHVAQGLFKSLIVQKCIQNGGNFIFWVADWFALMNDKMSGDIDKIKTVGRYFIQVWKACGMDVDSGRIQFKWASEELLKPETAGNYWGNVLDIARRFTTSRIKKCGQIMGRKDDSLSVAQLLYPIMQCCDVFFLKADICQLGLDQRKVNMLAREYAGLCHRRSPVILSQGMMPGLLAGMEKMSKSIPGSAVFMEDSAKEVEQKIRSADIKAVRSYLKTFFEGENFDNVDEEECKAKLIEYLNRRIEKVRKVFSEGENKKLFELVQEYKKESKILSKPKWTVGEKTQVLISLPLPEPGLKVIPFGLVFSTVLKIQKAAIEGKKVTLLIPDLRSFLSRSFNLDTSKKAQTVNPFQKDNILEAYFAPILSTIEAFTKTLSPSPDIKFLRESDLLLEDINSYMLNVINAGRHIKTNVLTDIVPQSDKVGPLISILFRIASCLALNPEQVFVIEETEEKLFGFTKDFIHKLGLSSFEVINTEITLYEKGEPLTISDTKDILKKRVKQAFCEPENVKDNPPLSLVNVLSQILGAEGSFEDRIGDLSLDGKADKMKELKAGFEQGKVHPKDLKEVATKLLLKAGEVRDKGLQTEDSKKGLKVFQKYVKRVSK
eukprot:maker-scaffold_33-snap-gene-3.75-mRNA-1 protein AED:0.01 eAED:0.01 QI:296/1/1/1/0.5/0.6/5/97/659